MSELASIPWAGVRRVLADWSGPGDLLDVLAGTEGHERTWSRRDLELRANWLSYKRLMPYIDRLPTRVMQWLDAIPASSHSQRLLAQAPGPRTRWVDTRIDYGWPARTFVIDHREKVETEMLRQVGAWLCRVLEGFVSAVSRIEDGVPHGLQRRAAALSGAFGTLPALELTRRHIEIARATGYPWNVAARVASELRPDLEELALGLVAPDEELQARVFHIGVLGGLLKGP